jgi:hypothetical protein
VCVMIGMQSHLPLASCWFLAWLILWPWRWRQQVHPKCWLTFNRLLDIISQETELFLSIFQHLLVFLRTAEWFHLEHATSRGARYIFSFQYPNIMIGWVRAKHQVIEVLSSDSNSCYVVSLVRSHHLILVFSNAMFCLVMYILAKHYKCQDA